MEIWKDIFGWEGYYQVSDTGRVRSLDRTVPRGGGRMTIVGKMTTLSELKDGSGRLVVRLQRGNSQVTRYVHELVAKTFIGPRPDKNEIHHIDENVKNNKLGNLTYIDYADHRRYHYSGERAARGKLTSEQVLEMRRLYSCGEYSVRKLSRMFGIAYSSARMVVNRSSWKHVP